MRTMWTERGSEFIETFGDPLVDGFLGVGVLVATMLLAMRMCQAKWGELWHRRLMRHRAAGPALAAVLSLPPGCSGVIMIISMYSQRQVTYGAVIAALLSTMGDAAWLIIAVDPVLAIQLKALFFFVGLVGGFAVDLLAIAPRGHSAAQSQVLRIHAYVSHSAPHTTVSEHAGTAGEKVLPEVARPGSAGNHVESATPVDPAWWDRLEPCCITDSAQPRPRSTPRWTPLVTAFWALIALGLIVEVPVEFNLIDEESIPVFFGISGYMLLGLIGFGVAVLVALNGRRHRRACHCTDPRSAAAILRHTAYQVATIITIVALLFLLTVAVTESTGFDPLALPFAGVTGIVMAALLGLVPSCGLEIVVAGLFLAGGMPLPALLTYLVSHDGAGLLPLFAVHRRSALLSTVLTTVPAVAVGLVALALL